MLYIYTHGVRCGLIMNEPENYTLRVLIEFRNEFHEFKARTDRNFARIDERLDTLTQALAGSIAANSYINGGVEKRFEAMEKRLAVLEKDG
jgi:hypothetical protein